MASRSPFTNISVLHLKGWREGIQCFRARGEAFWVLSDDKTRTAQVREAVENGCPVFTMNEDLETWAKAT